MKALIVRLKMAAKPLSILHGAVMLFILFNYAMREFIIFNVQNKTLLLPGGLSPSGIPLIFVAGILGLAFMFFQLVVLWRTAKIEKFSNPAPDFFAGALIFMITIYMSDKQLALIRNLFDDLTFVIMGIPLTFFTWLVTCGVIFQMLRDSLESRGWKVEIDNSTAISIIGITAAPWAFFTFIINLVY